MADPFYGEIRTFGFPFAPVNWAFCNGSELNIAQYQALYSVIGTTYGTKNENVSFSLPNLCGRVAVGAGSSDSGQGSCTVGQMDGVETVTLTQSNQGVHDHSINVATPPVSQLATQLGATPSNFTLLCRPRQAIGTNFVSYLAYDSTDFHTVPMASNIITPVGSSSVLAHENRQPFLVLNFCICIQNGVYPDRS